MTTTSVRPKAIKSLFNFLKKNQKINRKIQEGFIRESLSPLSVSDRAHLIMHKAFHTQAHPKLDYLIGFFKELSKHGVLENCADLRSFLVTTTGSDDLFQGLSAHKGWGGKTAALFLRNLAIVDESPILRQSLWSDIDVMERNEVWLPVDGVIISIFSQLELVLKKSNLKNFNQINTYLRDELAYKSKDMLIWDDLWFWGFITQKGKKGAVRLYGWNEAKYWGIVHAPKDARSVNNIQKKSLEFLKLLK